jgi:ketosteroid isomerase-like protein
MSAENVEIVRALIPPPEIDVGALIRDDVLFEGTVTALADVIDPDVEAVAAWQGGSRRTYVGIDGFRQLWLDWLEPWTTYRTEVERLVDAHDQVVALIHDRAGRPDSDAEFDLRSGSVWDLRDGRVVRVEFFRNQTEALEAAGLSE